ncbi:MAG: type pilin-like family protein [Candidatus Hydrogenedentes bacterium]|nr:type pilin-like family protein [Candidatus Hydrogenedentota bacterium]
MKWAKRVVVLLGAGALIYGTFLPLLAMPDLKDMFAASFKSGDTVIAKKPMNAYEIDNQSRRLKTGKGDGYAIAAAAALTALVALWGKFRLLWWTGLVNLLTVVFAAMNFQLQKTHIIKEVEGQPMRDMIVRIVNETEPCYGWWILSLGILLVFVGAALPRRWRREEEPMEIPPTMDGRSEATGIVRYKFEEGPPPPQK